MKRFDGFNETERAILRSALMLVLDAYRCEIGRADMFAKPALQKHEGSAKDLAREVGIAVTQ